MIWAEYLFFFLHVFSFEKSRTWRCDDNQQTTVTHCGENKWPWLPQEWRKCNLVSGHGLCGSQLGWAMNWMDRPRTSANERMLSGRRAVVIAWWAGAGFGRFFIDLSFLREQSPWSYSGLDFCVLAYCGSVHHCFPSHLSTTTQGAIVKLRGASSEVCHLSMCSV